MMLTIGTRNQQGVGDATRADGDLVAYTEASGRYPAGHASWRPKANRGLAISWEPNLFIMQANGYTKAYAGVKLFTPTGGAAWVAGTTSDGREVALVCTHLMNNAWGPVKRPMRAIRRRYWNTGMRTALNVVRGLQSSGYTVFLAGDFNRHERGFVPGMNDSAGEHYPTPYDRVFYPDGVWQIGAPQRGQALGSDHLSYIVDFRVR